MPLLLKALLVVRQFIKHSLTSLFFITLIRNLKNSSFQVISYV